MFHRHGFPFSGPFQDFKNNLEYLILDIIKDKPGHGHEIVHAIEEQFGGFFSPGPDEVYPTLQMLVDMGYVTTSDKDGKKLYTITGEGQEHLKKRQDTIQKFKFFVKGPWNRGCFTGGFSHHRCGMWV